MKEQIGLINYVMDCDRKYGSNANFYGITISRPGHDNKPTTRHYVMPIEDFEHGPKANPLQVRIYRLEDYFIIDDMNETKARVATRERDIHLVKLVMNAIYEKPYDALVTDKELKRLAKQFSNEPLSSPNHVSLDSVLKHSRKNKR